MNHGFNTEIAKEYDIETAIILENMYFWIKKNEANKQHFHDGKYWTYNSVSAFSKIFDYMSESKIRRTLDKMKSEGLIETGNYNKVAYDRTIWYCLTEKALCKLSNCICHIEQMDLTEQTNGFDASDEPIPVINKDINSGINKYNTQSQKPKKIAEKRKKYGEYSHVLLTDTQYQKLVGEWGETETERMITLLDEGIEEKGYKYKNFYLALKKWKSNEKKLDNHFNKSVYGQSAVQKSGADKYVFDQAEFDRLQE